MSKRIFGYRPGEGQPSRADSSPRDKGQGQRAEAARRQREAAALRENLLKRKAQQRSRRTPAPSGNTGGGPQTGQ